MIRTDVLLVPSVLVRLFADLVDFKPTAIEFVADRGVTCTHISHNRTSVIWPLWKRKKDVSGKRSSLRNIRKTHVLLTRISPVELHDQARVGRYDYNSQLGIHATTYYSSPLRDRYRISGGWNYLRALDWGCCHCRSSGLGRLLRCSRGRRRRGWEKGEEGKHGRGPT
jgi:hypothetical protein